QAMARWMARSASENRHGRHRYACEDFLVSNDEIDARLMFYRQRYAVAYENARATQGSMDLHAPTPQAQPHTSASTLR
ncbi:hypothetical protein, partial [Aquabacterium sp.]|uniref:hypothetical protein n=1 Tax=Aquabacterium sp. TaxID=1872578 RepID=UPI002C76F266